MLVKINHVGDSTVMVTKLDIDDYGTIIPLRDLELKLPDDDSVIQTLKASPYAAIFADDEDDGTIILAKGITEAELNREKEKTVSAVNKTET